MVGMEAEGMSNYYLRPEDFAKFLGGLRNGATVKRLRAVYVDGPRLGVDFIDLVIDQDGGDCIIKRGGQEVQFYDWVLTETRHGKRIDLKWEASAGAVVYEHREEVV